MRPSDLALFASLLRGGASENICLSGVLQILDLFIYLFIYLFIENRLRPQTRDAFTAAVILVT